MSIKYIDAYLYCSNFFFNFRKCYIVKKCERYIVDQNKAFWFSLKFKTSQHELQQKQKTEKL